MSSMLLLLLLLLGGVESSFVECQSIYQSIGRADACSAFFPLPANTGRAPSTLRLHSKTDSTAQHSTALTDLARLPPGGGFDRTRALSSLIRARKADGKGNAALSSWPCLSTQMR
jgi:hypothetical protein